MVVCHCEAVNDRTIRDEIERSLDAVTWVEVFNDGGNALSAFAFGYAAP